MNVITTAALANLKKNKSRNILIGIAIGLTAFLLTLLPTMVSGQLSLQFQAVNELYPPVHGAYRNVNEKTAARLSEDESFETVGLRETVGQMYCEDREAVSVMLAYDDAALKMSEIELKKGKFPERADEIVVSEGTLKAMGLEGDIGDKIKVPYQPSRKDRLLKAVEREFTISGMTEDTQESLEKGFFSTMVSEEFAKETVPKGEHNYEAYFQLKDIDGMVTEKIEERIRLIGETYGIKEEDITENSTYLFANYVDVSLYAGLGALIAAIVLSGILTIYSIYYVSMLDKVQEYGRLRAIGATKVQIRKLVLREGFAVAAIAVPIGIILGLAGGVLLIKVILEANVNADRILTEEMKVILANKEARLVKWWILALAAAVSLLTVYLSLLRPMHKAGRITAMEALRYQGDGKAVKKGNERRGYKEMSILKLTASNLGRNKRRTTVTVAALGVTGILFVVAATLCCCMNAEDITREEIRKDIKVTFDSEQGDEMHPEWELSAIQQKNPMSEELRRRIESIDGVISVETRLGTVADIRTSKEKEESRINLDGIDDKAMKELERYVTKGSLDDPALKNGTGVVCSRRSLELEYPDWDVGDTLLLKVMDGKSMRKRQVTIAAIADAPTSLIGYYMIMPKAALEDMCREDLTSNWDIAVEKGKEDTAAKEIGGLISGEEILYMKTFSEVNQQSKDSINFMLRGSYGILLVLGLIGILNLVNTMINSVHVRRKELGMLQAIGMSGRQTVCMLWLEGLFYTAGTLAVSLGLGSTIGYAAYLWAKDGGIMSIRNYHYPALPAMLLAVIVLAVQILVTYFVNRSFKKLSLIERIRFAD